MREEKLQDNSQRQHAMLEMETPEMRKRDFRTFPSVGILCYSWKLLTRGKRDSMTRRYAMLQLETPDKREERVKEKQLEMRYFDTVHAGRHDS